MTLDTKTLRRALLVAILLIAIVLIYSYLSTRVTIKDASNDSALSAEFDRLNPGIAGTNGGNAGV